MGITDLFSKQQRPAPDVYQYEVLPEPFRVQAAHILNDVLTSQSGGYGTPDNRVTEAAYQKIHGILCREYGRRSLHEGSDPRRSFKGSWEATVLNFLLSAPTKEALDVLHVGFDVAEQTVRDTNTMYSSFRPVMQPKDGIHELNTRFREHGIGFQLEGGRILRMDSEFLHTEAIKPTLQLLSDRKFAGVNAEFLKAHEHYRQGRHAEAMNECLKALESCLKVICQRRKWTHKDNDTAAPLLKVVFDNGLVPTWLQSEFAALRSTLESGVPTARNRVSGHGSGAQPRQVPGYFAAYLLHLTAAAILFLANAEKDL